MTPQTGQSSHHVVIGIDLGSRYSAVAFAVVTNTPGTGFRLSRVLKDIMVVREWPHNPHAVHGSAEIEVKSAVHFSDQPGQEISWGNSVPDIAPDVPRQAIEFFKLLLLPRPRIPKKLQDSEFFRNTERMARLCGKQAEEVTASFLGCLWEHARMYIADNLQSDYHNPSFHFVVTLPADWPEEARDSMRRALDLGMNLNSYSPRTLSFIREPDAAAIEAAATISALGNANNLAEGDAFTIVDAGGTTVDLVTYRIGATSPLEIYQCVEPIAVPAGSAFVDDSFEAALRRKTAELFPSEPVLSHQEVKRILALQLPNIQRAGLKSWSSLKLSLPRRFDHAAPMNSGPYKPLFATISFTPRNIQDVFIESGIREISQAVALQANAANANSGQQTIVKFVYMVGGYSHYDYLLEWLCNEHGGARVVHRPSNMGSSISLATVRGAVIHGLNTVARSMNIAPAIKVSVLHPTSRASFGICSSDRLQLGGQQVPEPGISWILHMGHVPGDHMASGEILLAFSESTAVVSIKVYACTANPCPAVITPEVEDFATLTIPVDRNSFHGLECKQGLDGTTLYHLRVQISMDLYPANALVIRTSYQGKALIDDQTFSTIGY